ncbi:MAG: SDR family oxidoreductase [Aromatoleum sp.]|jgi:NAD(P)H dehydrogenase (quinone)|uniref:SDR family oxidoreductase n=1 Tax=Aromatoleum sp. TaxID=2307007 RepID=UPI002894FCAA|nr:SDR family oxidoreductase [Aromatoleum sp.]MDT3672445.1 SDR family oxidoreductase [Aromatoleum sp.]
MILVTGATGQLGQRIVRRLFAGLSETGAGRLAASVRDVSRAAELAARGIDVRRADFDDRETLMMAFSGVERLVLISTDGPKDIRIAQHRNAIEAAKAAGVGHIYYTSFLDADADSPSEFAQVHAATEATLAGSGLDFTLLRNGLYADFLPMNFAAALESGVLQLPAGEGKVSYVSRNDLAEAIAAAVLAPRLEKKVYELTGQSAHDYRELAAKVGRAAGKTLRYEPVSEDEYVASLEAAGLPAKFARALGNMYSAAAENRFARTTTDFAALVGHPPRSIDCLVAEFFRAA